MVGNRLRLGNRTHFDLPAQTQGEMETAVCEGISRFEQEYIGRGRRTFTPT